MSIPTPYVPPAPANVQLQSFPFVYNALQYGAIGNGIADDSLAIRTAISAIQSAGGGILHFPAGTYVVGQDGANPYCIDLKASNITLSGVKGLTWLQQSTNVLAAQTALIRANEISNVTIRDMGFDGNWGNAVTYVVAASNNATLPTSTIHVLDTSMFPSSGTFVVADNGTTGEAITYAGKTATTFTGCTGGTGTLNTGMAIGLLDASTGINFPTQIDPKNHGIAIRGCSNVLIDNCVFKNNYGDGIWLGHGATTGVAGTNYKVTNCTGDICARDGITLGGPCSGISIFNTRWTNHFSKGFDVETDNTFDVGIDRCYFGGWFNAPNHSGTTSLTVKWNAGAPDESKIPKNYRITRSTFLGPVILEGVEDLVFRDNRIVLDWAGVCFAPIFLQFYVGAMLLEGNYIYDRAGQQGTSHQGSIALFGAPNAQQSSVVIRNNTIRCKNGNVGIRVLGTGGTAGDAGTASAVTATTLTDGSKTWTASAYVNHYVRMGTAVAMVSANSTTVLTLGAWVTATGNPAPTPAAGAYEISATGRYVDVLDNHIDCTNDGNGAGGFGISVAAASSSPGARIRVEGNDIRNAGIDAINVAPPGSAPNAWRHLVIKHNIAYDDQVTPTCTSVVRFTTTTPANITVFDMGDNLNGQGVANILSGLTAGTWRISGGTTEQWMGFGAPAFSAPKGSTYQRIDGGAGTCFYVNESGAAAWVGK